MTIDSYPRLALRLFIPAYLAACILLGGASREGFIAHAALAGVASIGLLAIFLFQSLNWLRDHVRTIYLFVFLLVGIVCLQLIPLPQSVWGDWAGRDVVIEGFEVLGQAVPNLPLSFTPEQTFRSLTQFLPPLFIFTLMATLPREEYSRLLLWAIPLLAAVSAALGGAQMATGSQSEFYLYEITNRGFPVGIFSNANHQATLMLIALPFIAVLIARRRGSYGASDVDIALNLLIGMFSLLILLGLFGAGSLAGYGIFIIVLAGCFVLLSRRRRKGDDEANDPSGKWFWLAGGGVIAFAIALTLTSPTLDRLGVTSFGGGELSRLGILDTSQDVLADHYLTGAGLGAFDEVYKLYEDGDAVTGTFANHAHNDYLQWLIEMGLPGAILLALFILWWASRCLIIWTSPPTSNSAVRQAASLGTLVIFLHSFVDYPLRTPAISVLGAVCLALMIVPHRPYGSERPKKSQQIDL
ncbi:MAG: O-antigen ligase family protein [Pseudomonadota bacterium]